MSQDLGKIEKPSAEQFKGKRKLFFVPLVHTGREPPAEYVEKLNKYWTQVEEQLAELELKLGPVSKIYHELVPFAGEAGMKLIKDLNEHSYRIVSSRVEKGAQLQATEDADTLTELMDWTRCLATGLQNQKVLSKVYEFYSEAGKKRNEFLAKHTEETLQAEEIGIVFMREGHHVQFPQYVEVFYISPPALDEINRWLRDQEAKLHEKTEAGPEEKEGD